MKGPGAVTAAPTHDQTFQRGLVMTYRTCDVPGCNRIHYGRGWCNPHWQQWRRTGIAPQTAQIKSMRHTEAFILKALEIDTDDCIMWPDGWATNRAGYGQATYKGKGVEAHRAICRLAHGEPDPGLHAAHWCGNPGCCNKKHIRWATPKENNADKLTHGTATNGEKHPQAKLTAAQVRAIRDSYIAGRGPENPGNATDLGKSYGVDRSTIYQAATGKTWKHFK